MSANIELEEKCKTCGGDGRAPGRLRCETCNGVGSVPTENGERVLALVRRYFKASIRSDAL